jgi:hypothetical protein
MFACCLAGLNSVDLSRKTGSLDPMDPLSVDNADVHVNRHLIHRYLFGETVTDCDRRTLSYYLSDPLPILCERLPLFQDDRPGIAGSLDKQTSVLSTLDLPNKAGLPCILP